MRLYWKISLWWTRIWVLGCFLICSCTTAVVKETQVKYVDNSFLGKKITEQGFPSPKDMWQLECNVFMHYDQNRHSHTHARLLFQQYQFADGSNMMVLSKQIEPAYTLLSYTQGLFFSSYHTHTRFLVTPENESKIKETSKKVLEEWKQQYPELAEQPKREFKDLPFLFSNKLYGNFYFMTDAKGTIPDRIFSEKGGLFNQLQSHFKWDKPDAPRRSFHPNIFRTLVHALKTLKPVEYEGKSDWQIEDKTSIPAVVDIAIQLIPSLAKAIPQEKERSFTISYQHKNYKEGNVIFADVKKFDNPDLGSGFTLQSYERKQIVHPENQQLISDDVKFKVGGGDKKILYSLSFRKHDPE